MGAITHVVLIKEALTISLRLVEFDGDVAPTTAQVRTAFRIRDDQEFSIVDIRSETATWISATGEPDGLEHCTLRDLGAQLELWATNRFSAIDHLSSELLNNKTPSTLLLENARAELLDIQPEIGEILEEEAAFAHKLASELERRFARQPATI
jgi:hypothetical protein